MIRLTHRRNLHILSFIFNYKDLEEYIDVRDLPTRRHDGILFKQIIIVNHKVKRSPLHRAIKAWNDLPVNVRNIDSKQVFKRTLLSNIQNPFKKVL